MVRANEAKRERVHLRLDSSAKRKLERAAAAEKVSVSSFIRMAATAAADRIFDPPHERIVMTEEDWEIFFDALSNPLEPEKALRKIAGRSRKGDVE